MLPSTGGGLGAMQAGLLWPDTNSGSGSGASATLEYYAYEQCQYAFLQYAVFFVHAVKKKSTKFEH